MTNKKASMGRVKTSNRAKRAEKFRVIICAEQLERHTYIKCRNLHIFPKKDRGGLPLRMVNEATDILADVMDANDLDLRNDEERMLRRATQRHALRMCRLLIHHIELTHDLTPLDDDAFSYWAQLANDTKNQIAAWLTSDRKRLEQMQ